MAALLHCKGMGFAVQNNRFCRIKGWVLRNKGMGNARCWLLDGCTTAVVLKYIYNGSVFFSA